MLFRRLGFSKPRKAYLGDLSECFRNLLFLSQGRIWRLELVVSSKNGPSPERARRTSAEAGRIFLMPVISPPHYQCEDRNKITGKYVAPVYGSNLADWF